MGVAAESGGAKRAPCVHSLSAVAKRLTLRRGPRTRRSTPASCSRPTAATGTRCIACEGIVARVSAVSGTAGRADHRSLATDTSEPRPEQLDVDVAREEAGPNQRRGDPACRHGGEIRRRDSRRQSTQRVHPSLISGVSCVLGCDTTPPFDQQGRHMQIAGTCRLQAAPAQGGQQQGPPVVAQHSSCAQRRENPPLAPAPCGCTATH